VEKAKAETTYLFKAAGLHIAWFPCGDFETLMDKVSGPVLIIRVRMGSKPHTVGPMYLSTLGKAFLSDEGDGELADVYFDSIQESAARRGIEQDTLLGCVMAHELGHLLLGPGHEPRGLMQPNWNPEALEAIEKRRLKFSRNDSTRLQRAWQKLNAANEESRGKLLSAGMQSH
jgi:hypothetical protein